MLVYLTRPIKGYAHREGEVIHLPDTLATEAIKNGSALPYQGDKERLDAPVENKTTPPVKGNKKTVKK